VPASFPVRNTRSSNCTELRPAAGFSRCRAASIHHSGRPEWESNRRAGLTIRRPRPGSRSPDPGSGLRHVIRKSWMPSGRRPTMAVKSVCRSQSVAAAVSALQPTGTTLGSTDTSTNRPARLHTGADHRRCYRPHSARHRSPIWLPTGAVSSAGRLVDVSVLPSRCARGLAGPKRRRDRLDRQTILRPSSAARSASSSS